ncbi:unnamed protein product [Rangifer tarandus platyrhynchus]|uniref:Uncharacterized protein n=2 Tax=Rangifer tarandus platyrhynchus TaxID=3082113 RepID=A0AC59Y0M4_RANTA
MSGSVYLQISDLASGPLLTTARVPVPFPPRPAEFAEPYILHVHVFGWSPRRDLGAVSFLLPGRQNCSSGVPRWGNASERHGSELHAVQRQSVNTWKRPRRPTGSRGGFRTER